MKKKYTVGERFYHQGFVLGESFKIFEIYQITDNFIYYIELKDGEPIGPATKAKPELFERIYLSLNNPAAKAIAVAKENGAKVHPKVAEIKKKK